MSGLFFKVSWPANVDRYRELKAIARRNGQSFTVRNTSRTRGLPIFLFYLDRKDGSPVAFFSSLDDAAKALEGLT